MTMSGTGVELVLTRWWRQYGLRPDTLPALNVMQKRQLWADIMRSDWTIFYDALADASDADRDRMLMAIAERDSLQGFSALDNIFRDYFEHSEWLARELQMVHERESVYEPD